MRQRGAVWRRWTLGATVAGIGCALVISSPAWATNGWSGPTTIDNPNPPQYISCPSSTFCVAVGTNGYAQTYNGSSWGTPQFIDPSLNLSGSPLISISCPSTSFCAAVDLAGYALTFNGSTWTPRSQIDTTGNSVSAVGCASASFCVAGDVGGNGFVYNGTSWSGPITVNNTSNHQDIGDIACPSTSFCVAVGESRVGRDLHERRRDLDQPAADHRLEQPDVGVVSLDDVLRRRRHRRQRLHLQRRHVEPGRSDRHHERAVRRRLTGLGLVSVLLVLRRDGRLRERASCSTERPGPLRSSSRPALPSIRESRAPRRRSVPR